jgi:hypothetical protein
VVEHLWSTFNSSNEVKKKKKDAPLQKKKKGSQILERTK